MEEKPQIVYCMPRTRSTAILFASKKEIKLNEPFSFPVLSPSEFAKRNSGNISEVMKNSLKREFLNLNWQKDVNFEAWDNIKKDLNNPKSISKFLGISITEFDLAKNWFLGAQINKTHNIFVVYRDLEEICWSYVIANRFGFFKENEVYDRDKTVPELAFCALEQNIKEFLNNMPINANLISWENLPSTNFDKSKTTVQEQYSSSKKSLLKNIEYCSNKIDGILEKYQPQIESKVLSLPWIK